jgi:hypothetical protein
VEKNPLFAEARFRELWGREKRGKGGEKEGKEEKREGRRITVAVKLMMVLMRYL